MSVAIASLFTGSTTDPCSRKGLKSGHNEGAKNGLQRPDGCLCPFVQEGETWWGVKSGFVAKRKVYVFK